MRIEFSLFGKDAEVCGDGASLPQLLAVFAHNCAKRQSPSGTETVLVVKGRNRDFARFFSDQPLISSGRDEPPDGDLPSYGIINGDGSLDDPD